MDSMKGAAPTAGIGLVLFILHIVNHQKAKKNTQAEEEHRKRIAQEEAEAERRRAEAEQRFLQAEAERIKAQAEAYRLMVSSSSRAKPPEVPSNKLVISAGKPAHNQAVSFYPSLPLHEDIRDLLWIGDGPAMNLSKDDMASDKDVFVLTEGIMGRVFFTIDEPSLIYTELVITKPEDESVVSRPPYFPKYKDLSPEQRYIYLKLLSNPYNTDIDVGYVFILYYGLERHLLQGNFDAAFQVILKLRDVHKNKSFQSYSGNALILSALLKNKGEYIPLFINSLDKEYEFNFSDNLFLMCYFSFDIPLAPKDIIRMAKSFEFTNHNYIKKYPDLFLTTLREVLAEKKGTDKIELKKYITKTELKKIPNAETTIFANSSIIGNTVTVPQLTENFNLKKEMNNLLTETHERVKAKAAAMRKDGIPLEEVTPTPKKKAAVKKEGELTRSESLKYMKLLKNKLDETLHFEEAEKIIKNTLADEDYERFCLYLTEQVKSSIAFNEKQKETAKDTRFATGLVKWRYEPEGEGKCLICKEYAEKDLGHGPGIYPVDQVPAMPHPGCSCSLSPILKDSEVVRKERLDKYFGDQ